jgi:PmbA protein
VLKREQAQSIFDRVREYSQADETEVLIHGGRSALTRFANNTIHQNVAEEGYVVSIRAALEGKTARATTNKLDDDSLKRAAESALTLARMQERDPDLLPMPSPDEVHQSRAWVHRHFAETAAVTPEDRAQAVEKMVRIAKSLKQTAAGIFSTSEQIEALINSKGLTRFYEQTSSEISITMLGSDSSGWQKANSPNVSNLNPQELAEISARKSVESAAPRELAPGKYTVVLEPAAVLDLVGFMFFDFGGAALLEQRSFLNERLNTELFGKNINIVDDAYHPLQSGAPFDGEGLPRQRVPLVENGVPGKLVYARSTAHRVNNSEWAQKVGRVSATGHGFPLPNEIGDAPMNIVFEGPRPEDEKTIDQMISSTQKGVLVTRLWYIREVDPYEKILTGMTRDGTFLIENGKLRYGIRNFRFNQSLIDMLKSVEEMGRPVRASGEETFDMVVPAMKVRDFNFTEVTKF